MYYTHISLYVYTIYIYICIRVCMYIYIYIYIYTSGLISACLAGRQVVYGPELAVPYPET